MTRDAVSLVLVVLTGVILFLMAWGSSVSNEDRAVLLGNVQIMNRPPKPGMVPCPNQAAVVKEAGFGEGWTWYCAEAK